MPEALRSIGFDPAAADEEFAARCQAALDIVQGDLDVTGYGQYRMRAYLDGGGRRRCYPPGACACPGRPAHRRDRQNAMTIHPSRPTHVLKAQRQCTPAIQLCADQERGDASSAAMQNGGYLRIGAPAPVTERDAISGPAVTPNRRP